MTTSILGWLLLLLALQVVDNMVPFRQAYVPRRMSYRRPCGGRCGGFTVNVNLNDGNNMWYRRRGYRGYMPGGAFRSRFPGYGLREEGFIGAGRGDIGGGIYVGGLGGRFTRVMRTRGWRPYTPSRAYGPRDMIGSGDISRIGQRSMFDYGGMRGHQIRRGYGCMGVFGRGCRGFRGQMGYPRGMSGGGGGGWNYYRYNDDDDDDDD